MKNESYDIQSQITHYNVLYILLGYTYIHVYIYIIFKVNNIYGKQLTKAPFYITNVHEPAKMKNNIKGSKIM